MRGSATQHAMVAPKSLGETLSLLADTAKGYRLFAGGTDLMVAFERGLLVAPSLISIWHLRELRGINDDATHVMMGALTTYTDLIESAKVREHAPALAQAARETAAVAIRNRGTVGGNIANASPAADLPPALLVYDAEVELTSSKGSRWIAYASFHTGYKTTVMRPDEMLTRVRLPKWSERIRFAYRKVGTRKAQAISKVCMAATVRDSGQVRLAFGSLAPTVIRAIAVEAKVEAALKSGLDAKLIDSIANSIAGDVRPIDDIRSTADYRARVTVNLVHEWLSGLAS